MKFKVQASEWLETLTLAGSVKPKPVDSQGSVGLLCVVRGEECFIYSEDEKQKTRTSVKVTEPSAEGAFVYPYGKFGDLKFVDGVIEVESRLEEGAHLVEYTTEDGTSAIFQSFDPQILHSLDKDLSGATKGPELPVALLKEALNATKAYVGDVTNTSIKPHLLSLQLFSESDEKGNGYMLATNGNRYALFHSPTLKNKGLVVHALRLPLLLSFLSKSEGTLQVYNSATSTYLVNSSGRVIGWADQVATHKFGYYPLEADKFILRLPKSTLEQGLAWIREVIPSGQDRVHLEYNHEGRHLTIRADGGHKKAPIPVIPLDEGDGTVEYPVRGGSLSKTASVAFNVNVDWLLEMIRSLRSQEVDFRIAPHGNTGAHVLRTIESYFLNTQGKVVPGAVDGGEVYECQVMRFMSSKT